MIWNKRLIVLVSTLLFSLGFLLPLLFVSNEGVVAKPTITPTPTRVNIPTSYTIPIRTHVFQSFNNCGPAALSMTLSYHDVNISQSELGRQLRPYQIAGGDNDDKSVTLEELSLKAEELGFATYHRPNGNVEILKRLIALDLPVITRTWTTPTEDIGHYRIVRGYNETQILQDDSLQNKNLLYTYDDFKEIWKKFNYEYLVLVPKEKLPQVQAILGENTDYEVAWRNAVELSTSELNQNPDELYARFNLSVAYYNVGEFKKSIDEFEKIESQLSFRTLWYQIEPIEAYYQVGNYDRVFQITDRILNNQNRAFSELYLLRGNSYLKQGNRDAAKAEFEKAVLYNVNLQAAQSALSSVNQVTN